MNTKGQVSRRQFCICRQKYCVGSSACSGARIGSHVAGVWSACEWGPLR